MLPYACYPQANVCMAKLYAGIARNTLRDHKVTENPDAAFGHWLRGAEAGDLEAMYQVANYYEGSLVAPAAPTCYKTAVSWYETLMRKHEELAEVNLKPKP
jgi:hypothetical protein